MVHGLKRFRNLSLGALLHTVSTRGARIDEVLVTDFYFPTYANSLGPASFFPEMLSNHLATLLNMSALNTHFPTTNTTCQKYVFKLFSTIPRALGGTVLQRRMKPLVVVFCQVFVARRKCQSSLTRRKWFSVDC